MIAVRAQNETKNASILSGRIGGMALLQLDLGGLNPVVSEVVPLERLDDLDAYAQVFARELVSRGIEPSEVHYTDSTHLVYESSSDSYRSTTPEPFGIQKAQAFYNQVIKSMGEALR